MALNNLGLGLSFIGRDRATPVIMRVDRAFGRLMRSVTSTSRGISQQLRSFQALEARMAGIALGSSRMAEAMRRSVGEVNGLVRGLDRASRSADRVGAGMSRRDRGRAVRRRGGGVDAGDVLRGVGTGIVAASGVLPFQVADFAGKFEQDLRRVQNISGATVQDLELLRQAAIEAGLATQFSPQEAVEGLEALASAGFSAQEQMRLLNTALDLAAGGQISIQQATSLSATVIKGFRLAGQDAVTFADKLLKTANLFKIRASELEPALAKATRGALVAGQSFDEMLVAVGLAKNIFPDAGAAGNSISRALQGLAQNAEFVKKELGVEVVDATGKFRNALDIFEEIDQASKGITNAAVRANVLNKALGGTFGLAGFSAVMASATEEAQKSGKTLGQVFDELRSKIDEAGRTGLAKSFAANLLDTFQGQKVILQGAVQTLAVVIGEPFARVLKPIVAGVARAVSAIARFISKIPNEIKDGIAAVVSFAAAFVGLVSGILAAKVAVGIMTVVFGALIKVVAATAVGIGAVVAIIAGLAMVVRRNIGGLGDLFERAYEAVSLFFRGTAQLFRQGGFSGAIRHEINRAENAGIKRFAINIFAIGFRIVRFFKGIGTGFAAALEAASPAFSRLRDALVALGEALGLVAKGGAEAAGGIPSQKFFDAGAKAGAFFARVLAFVADVIAILARQWTGVVSGVTATFTKFRGVFSGLRDAIGNFLEAIGGNLGVVADGVGTMGGKVQSFGRLVGTVIGTGIVIFARFATMVINVATWVVRAVRVMAGVIGPVIRFVIGIITRAVEELTALIGRLQDAVGFVADVAGSVKSSVGGFFGDVVDFVAGEDDVVAGPGGAIAAAGQALVSPVAGGEDDDGGRGVSALVSAVTRSAAAIEAAARSMESRPVVLEAEGQRIARVVDQGQRRDAALGFRAIPFD